MFKTLKKPIGFLWFLATEASQEILKRPKMAPKGHPKKAKTPKKMEAKIETKNHKKN